MSAKVPRASSRSLRALDALNLTLADVRDGIGPYLAIDLATKRWDPSRIGLVMAAMGIAAVIAQAPAGALIDGTRRKRAWLVAASAVVAMAAIAMVRMPTFPVILGAQAALGVASTVFAPAIAAISLGLVGHAKLARRTGRNEAFNHGGNVLAAVLAGLIGDSISYSGIFYLLAAMCGLSAISTLLIRGEEIDDDLARGSGGADEKHDASGSPLFDADVDPAPASAKSGGPAVAGVADLLRDRRILIFSLSIVLFHFANAAMLPLVGQKMTEGQTEGVAGKMSACIIAAQLVMIPVALGASRLAETWGRRPTFLLGFAVLPIRGLLYTQTANPYWLVAIQLLDGIGAGIFGVVGVLCVADLTRGTGRFNLMQGALAAATGIGAAASLYLTEVVVSKFGFNAGFSMLAGIAAVALVFFAVAMPETRPGDGSGPGTPQEDRTPAEAVL